MAKGFVVDTDKARQVGQRLTSAGKTIEGFPPGPQPRGPLGSGVLEQAWSRFESSLAWFRRTFA